MNDWDRYERRRREDRDRDRRRAEQEARKRRREFEMDVARRVADNPEALRVAFGLEDRRLVGEILGHFPKLDVSIDDLHLGEEPVRQIRSIYRDPSLSAPDKRHLIMMWLAACLDTRITQIEQELEGTPETDPGRRAQLATDHRDAKEKKDRVMQLIAEAGSQARERLNNLMRS